MEQAVTEMRYVNPNTVRVCVNNINNGEPSGMLISPYAPEAMPFTGVLTMTAKLDRFLTTIGLSQAYNTDRSFGAVAKPTARREKKEVKQRMSADVFETKLGEKVTFMIQIQFRQNSTWQGTITWTEQKKTQHFRSTLEMIKLMDSAMAPTDGGDFADWQDL